MHVLITVNDAWNILNFRRGLVEALLADGHRLTILAPAGGALDELQRLGCNAVPLLMDRKGTSPLRDTVLLLRLIRHFWALSPDVILSFTIKNNIFGALAARLLRLRFVPNVTGLGTAFLSGSVMQRIVERLYRVAFRSVQVVFFQNSDDRDLFLRLGIVRDKQAQLLPGSGIDLNHFKPRACPETGKVVFLLIARVLRQKGVLEYAEAAAILRETYPQAEFQLLGAMGVDNRSAIDPKAVQIWQENNTIKYLGTSTDVRKEIARADCIVLPSYREGTPRSLLEASAMELPVVATDVPGCRQVVEDRVSGLLCNVRDSESLSKAMKKIILMKPEQRALMGKAGRARMAAFYDQEHVIEAYRSILDALKK